MDNTIHVALKIIFIVFNHTDPKRPTLRENRPKQPKSLHPAYGIGESPISLAPSWHQIERGPSEAFSNQGKVAII